ncbi:MAG: fumarylacetoacetase [Betaproteobacteria bacterium]|nr:MAG: fumarylacetoacetase [Betaproteobacteria bacterium]
MRLDDTHDPALRSWVESAHEPGCNFPIQNLALGIFKRKGQKEPARGGVAIGDQILDLAALGVRTGPTLNSLAAMGRQAARKLRRELSRALSVKTRHKKRLQKHLVPMKQAELFLPVAIGDYSDFFTGIHHATNMGRMLRPDNPLLPNYKWLPIGYHGRGSSIVISGAAVRRPRGQLKPPDAPAPVYAASKRLDYEVELGFIAGTGNALGRPIAVGDALEHVFGAVLLNDWSARDMQAWEYQPLGPFLAKSFATTISPWIVTMDALEPYRCAAFARAADDPQPLPYLLDEDDQREGGLAIEVEMHLRTPKMKAPVRLSRGNFRDSYWTLAQIVAHQTSNGCNLQPGDLLGSGTISGASADSLGSLMELSLAGKNPLQLANGETRSFLEDGDEVIERGRCVREGYATIGFGEASGRIMPAGAK